MAAELSNTDSRTSSLLVWLLFVGAGLALAYLTARLTPHYVDDSPSYVEYEFASLDQICRATRMPGYPLWLLLLKKTMGIQFVPAAQVILHATAAWLLYRELAQWAVPMAARLAAAIAVAIGCTAADHVHTVSTDLIAASLGVMTATAVLRWARLDGAAVSWLPVVLAAVAVIFIRPAYLFLIPWIFVAGALLRHLKGTSWRSAWLSSGTVSLIAVLPIIAWMTLRLAVVGDFAVLPFGHQNLAGILIQLVSDEELQDVGGELGTAIVAAKQQYDAEIGFAEGEPGATMTIDARWHPMMWSVAFPASVKVAGDDLIDSHRALATLNKSIIKRYPLRYARWLLKSARRGAWAIAADIVMHPAFLVAISLMILVILKRAVVGRAVPISWEQTEGLRALTIVTWTYVIAKVGFVILTSVPIGRFSDAAAIFIPAWVAVVFLEAFHRPAKESGAELLG